MTSQLGAFRDEVREWCRTHVPAGWRDAQTGVDDEAFVSFQQSWFRELAAAGYAVPHWPAEWGGGMSTARQIVLYQELAAHDAPRLVLAFVSIHHAASTLLHAGTDEQRRRHLPAILDGEIWCQGFSEPDAGSDLASLSTSARKVDGGYLVNGQKVWASGAAHADWCLLLARTDPDAPKRRGISYFLLDMRTPGIDVRPIRQATGESHFCEMFLDDVLIPESQLVGEENAGWSVAQATLSAERGMTMLELAERLGNVGFRWLVEACHHPGPDGTRPIDDPVVLDRLASFDTEVAGLRSLCRSLVSHVDSGQVGPADASVVKLYYSELLQRLTDFGTEVVGLAGHTVLQKPISSGWESGAWVLDFVSSWEWTIPGGSSEIQRTIIGERGLGLPREPIVGCLVSDTTDLSELHDELRAVARDLLGTVAGDGVDETAGWSRLVDVGWSGLEVPDELGGSGATFAETAIVLEEMGRAAATSPFFGTAVLGVGALRSSAPDPSRDALLRDVASGPLRLAVAISAGADGLEADPPFRVRSEGGSVWLDGRAEFVLDAPVADRLLLAAVTADGGVVVVDVDAASVEVTGQPVLDATRRFGIVTARDVVLDEASVRTLDGIWFASLQRLADRAAVAVACDSLGLAAAMLDATVAYVGVRRQFDRPIGSFQAVKHACADMFVHLAVARELLGAAVEAVVTPGPDSSVAVSRAKSFVCGTAVDAVGTAMQLHGGIGYTWESDIHVYLKRAVLNRALFGSPAAHRRRLGAAIASDRER